MNRASSLSGDTLIACHFPLVQLPPWQLPVQALCGSSKRRLCPTGLTRAASLPEQDYHQREGAPHGTLRHTSSTCCSLQEDGGEDGEEDEGSDSSSARCDSASSPDEAPPSAGCLRKSRNSFLPSAEVDEEDEEDEDSDGDNLHRYREDSSFVLHGNSNWASSNAARPTSEPTQSGVRRNSAPSTGCDHEGAPCPPRHDSAADAVSMDCQCEGQGCVRGGDESGEDNTLRYDDVACRLRCDQTSSFPGTFSDGHPDDASDSSCDSSDGVLVNFSTIYNRSNNPDPSQHPCSPTPRRASTPAEGSIVLNLEPFPTGSHYSPSQGDETSFSPQDAVPSAPGWSPQALDSNCNLFHQGPQSPRAPQPQGLSSLEVSDLSARLQTQAGLSTGPTQKYYKLVTCDLSSQSSPSPAWSSRASCSPGETPSRASPGRPDEYFLFSKTQGAQVPGGRQVRPESLRDLIPQEKEPQKERRKSTPVPNGNDFDRPLCGGWDAVHVASFAEMIHAWSLCSSHSQASKDLCPIQEAVPLGPSQAALPPSRSLSQGSSTVTTHPSVLLELGQGECEAEAQLEGACSRASPVVRYSKAQRPTSLPVQPFVLLTPPGKLQPLGSLLDHYISHKHAKPGNDQPTGAQPGSKGKGTRLLTHLRPSPLGSLGPILLEALSSSDTCSTCTPSPDRLLSRTSLAPGRTGLGQTHTSPNRQHSSPSSGVTHSSACYTQTAQTHTGSIPARPYRSNIQSSNTLLNLTQPSPGKILNVPVVPQPSPDKIFNIPLQSQPSPGNAQICYNLVHLSPVRTHTGPPVSSSRPPAAVEAPPPAPTDPTSSFHSLATASPSKAPLASLGSLLSLAGSGLPRLEPACPGGQETGRTGDSFTMSDRPPVEFSLSPETSYESLSISHLQRRGLLKAVSLAVDLIMAHFGTSRDHEEKMRLGNSSRSSTIGGLVLEHLCPTIQNILLDGLRDHKLDLIIGQLPNHSWSMVDAFTQAGPSTRVLHSLVTKVQQCPLLTSHCMRLRAFIMGLLNLRSLEFWLSHLHSQKDLVMSHYHPWGFLSMSQGHCRPLFQELLLLVQPLSMLPFDLNLLLEPRLQQSGQLCCEEQGLPPPPCSTFLLSSWPLLRADIQEVAPASGQGPRDGSRDERDPPRPGPPLHGWSQGGRREVDQQERRERPLDESDRGLWLAPSPGWWQRQPAHVEGVVCSHNNVNNPSGAQGGVGKRGEEKLLRRRGEGERETSRARADPAGESLPEGGLRWAKLFGSRVDSSTRTQSASPSSSRTPARRRPSHWLQLDRSQLGLLAQSVWTGKRPGPGPGPGPERAPGPRTKPGLRPGLGPGPHTIFQGHPLT
ncbi:AP-4 complex accessory subunit RUSC2 [Osmerus mordax]|uniref:AP-4 complex accessory subunit RUSC2 n=1 Tax=Osmerus mordax TaxID=8014 RepID=UPI00350F85BE